MDYKGSFSIDEAVAWVRGGKDQIKFEGKTIQGIVGREWEGKSIIIKSSTLLWGIYLENCRKICLIIENVTGGNIFIESSKEVTIRIRDTNVTFLKIEKSEVEIEMEDVSILGNVSIETSEVQMEAKDFSVIGNIDIEKSKIIGSVENGKVSGNFTYEESEIKLQRKDVYIAGRIIEVD